MCTFYEPPMAEYECYEACWSHGRACRRCSVTTCYRQGWRASDVTADNAQRVKRKRLLTPGPQSR